MSEVCSWGDSGWLWQLRWRSVRYDGESIMEEEMLNFITIGGMHKEIKDHMVWKWDTIGIFSVKSAYMSFNNQSIGYSNDVFTL